MIKISKDDSFYLQRNTKQEAELQMNLIKGFFIILDIGNLGQTMQDIENNGNKNPILQTSRP